MRHIKILEQIPFCGISIKNLWKLTQMTSSELREDLEMLVLMDVIEIKLGLFSSEIYRKEENRDKAH